MNIELPCQMEDADRFLSEPQEGALDLLRGHEGDVIVLGAGGKMGLHLCLLLRRAFDALNKDNVVWAASRFSSLNSRDAYEKDGVKVMAGDFRDADFVASLPECSLVFYLVGAKFGTTDNPGLLREINVEVAVGLASRYRRARIVAFSTGCVYSFVAPASGGSTEDSATDPVGEYALSCLEREGRFVASSRDFGTPVALIRLNYSVEFRYGVLVDVAKRVIQDEPVDVTTGFVNVIWQNDALNQIVQCALLAASPAVPINITGPSIVSVRELAQRFGELFGKQPRIVGTEEPTAWLSDASRSHQRFGMPSVPLDTMVKWIAAWIAREGATYGKPTGFEKRDGRF